MVSRRREGGEIVDVVRGERAGRFFFVVVFDDLEEEEEDGDEGELANVWDRERVRRDAVVIVADALDIVGRERVVRPSCQLGISSCSSFRFSDSDEEEVLLSSPKLLASVDVVVVF